MHYLSTFPSGFDKVAEAALTGRLVKTTVTSRLDGALEYQTNAQPKVVADLRFFQNSFVVLKSFQDLGNQPLVSMMRYFLKRGLDSGLKSTPVFKNAGSFRIVTTENNRPVAVADALRTEVEGRIRRSTHLNVSRSGADTELWFAARKKSIGHIMVRFTKRRATEKNTHPGQLRPETANLLIFCSEPSHDDVFLDPFCGYGGIVLERMETHRAQLIHGIDSDPAKIQRLKDLAGRRNSTPTRWEIGDARTLSSVPDMSVTRVVTDPPWGAYSGAKATGTLSLYGDFILQLDRILVDGAVAVLLSGRDVGFSKVVKSKNVGLSVEKTYEVLISGKKGTVTVLRKGQPIYSVAE